MANFERMTSSEIKAAEKVRRLRYALSLIEWHEDFGWAYCQICHAERGDGHESDCPIGIVLMESEL